MEEATKPYAIRKDSESVHAYLKRMESGEDHPDARILTDLAEGNIQ